MWRRHSLILIPEEDVASELQYLMNDVNKHYDTSEALLWRSHVTVKSLGNVPDEKMVKIIPMMRNIAEETRPFNLILDGIRFYGSNQDFTGIYIPVVKTPELIDLHEKCVESFENYDGKDRSFKEGKKFNPHLTLVGTDLRGRKLEDAKKDLNGKRYNFEFSANQLTLASRVNLGSAPQYEEFSFMGKS